MPTGFKIGRAKALWVPGYAGYYASTFDGTIWSKARPGTQHKEGWQALKPMITNNGYAKVTLAKDGVHEHLLVHRVVALTWLTRVAGKTLVLHRNGKKQDNRVKNLKWGDVYDNVRDLCRHGTVLQQSHWKSVVPPERHEEIRQRYALFIAVKAEHSLLALAEEFGVSKNCIWSIAMNKRAAQAKAKRKRRDERGR